MSKYTATQNNFSSGELSPSLEGRTDLKEYANGASELLNMIPLKDGGITRRPATKEMVPDLNTLDAHDGSLYSFTSDIDEDVFVALSFKFEALGPLATVKAKYYRPFLDVTTPTSIYSLQGISLEALDVTVDVSDRFRRLVNELYSDVDLDFRAFNSIQIFDSILLTHPSGKIPPLIIIKKPYNAFDLTPRVEVYEYLDYSISRGTEGRALTFPNYSIAIGSGTSETAQILQVAGQDAVIFNFVNIANPERRVGDYFKIKISATEERVYKITSTGASAQQFYIDIIVGTNANVAATAEFVYNSWSEPLGFPRSCSIFQQRIAFGGTRSEPATIWYGNVENLFLMLNKKLLQDQDSLTDISGLDYYGTDISSDPFSITIASNVSTAIVWLESDRVQQVGTKNVEYTVAPVDGIFDRDHAQVAAQTFYGSKGGTTVRVQNEVLFASRDGKEMRANRFSFETGGNVSRLLSVLSRRMVYHDSDLSNYNSSFIKTVYQTSRGCVWVQTNQGSLVGLVLEESSQTLAWHKHDVGGEVVGMTVLPSPDGNSDMLILNVKRTYSGVDSNSIVIMMDSYDYPNNFGEEENSMHLDGYVDTIPTANGNLQNLNQWGYNNGEEVCVWSEGVELGKFTVISTNGGEIETALDASNVNTVVGRSYKSRAKSMLIKSGSRTGDPQIQISRVDSVAVNVVGSKHFKIGTSDGNLEDVDLIEDTAIELYTGIKNRSVASSGGREQRFIIETEKSYPLTILSVGVRGSTQD